MTFISFFDIYEGKFPLFFSQHIFWLLPVIHLYIYLDLILLNLKKLILQYIYDKWFCNIKNDILLWLLLSRIQDVSPSYVYYFNITEFLTFFFSLVLPIWQSCYSVFPLNAKFYSNLYPLRIVSEFRIKYLLLYHCLVTK